MSIEQEIAELRKAEALYEKACNELDRLQRDVMLVNPKLVVLPQIPANCWAILPRGWCAATGLSVGARFGPVPKTFDGEIAISSYLARRLIAEARS